MKLSPAVITALCLYLGSEAQAAKLKPGAKILLSKIDTLTLRNDQMTKSRRVEAIPQLKCVGGDGKGRYEVDVMRCKNQGSDYGDEDVSWACTANLPREFKLGATDVICEGYDNPDDNYVLKGSCGVEYRLALTDYGYEKFGSSAFSRSSIDSGVNWSAAGFWMIFISVFGWIIYSAYTSANSQSGRAPRAPLGSGRPSFWGGGGGGGGGNDPPPPYDPTPRPSPKPKYSTTGQQQRSGPGFWTGAAAGAAASAAGSYLMSGRNRERERGATSYGYSAPSYAGPSSYGGPSSYAGPSRPSGSSSNSESSSTAEATHSSTGFGQTRRR